MRSQWKRLLWAAMLSCAGFGATFTWYNFTKNKSQTNDEKPLAYVGKVTEEIQRRPATRLLWQEVNTGEPLYNGEAIRTSEKGEVRIQFADSNRYLDLEPESLIVIQQNKGEIALDLMEGSLFVAAAKEGEEVPGTSLVLNSANGKVDLSKASASLSKSSGNQVDVQVLQGSASIKDKSGNDKIISSGNSGALGANTGSNFNKGDLQILSPIPGKVTFIDADLKDNLVFKWKGFPPGLKVSLYTGTSRKDLREWTAVTPQGEDTLKTALPIGKPYWKLVAKDPKTLKIVGESSIYRADIQARYAPTVVFPMADAKFPVTKAPFDMAFKWQKGEETSRVVLEVAKDAGLKQKIATQNFTTEESFTLPALQEGEYFWRMSSYYEGSDKPILGKIQKFSVSKIVEKVVVTEPLVISWTVPEEKIQFYLDNPKLGLTWNVNRPAEVASWRLKYVEEGADPTTLQTMEVKDTKTDAKVGKPGRYIASLEAMDKDGQVIGASSPRRIAVAPLPLIPSPKILPLEGNLTAAADGRTELNWEKIEGAKEYMLTISNKDGKELKTLKYTANTTALKNLMPGEYQLTLTAVDQHGRTTEAGAARKLVVPDKSNLKAPTLKKIKVN